MYGELTQANGRYQLRFRRRLAHPPEKVWRALTAAEHLAAWFPTRIEGERATGAALRFVFANDEGPTLGGEMLIYQPPTLLEFRWGDDTLRFELEPDNAGTLLTFIDTFDELGRAARDAAGWHVCLDRLSGHLDGQTAPDPDAQPWQTVHAAYVERPSNASAPRPRPSAHRQRPRQKLELRPASYYPRTAKAATSQTTRQWLNRSRRPLRVDR
jgi:uncharacterized protein YndB with AHSA1/START domain